MTKLNSLETATHRPNPQLSRRSLVAAGAILAALGPATATRALAQGKGKGNGNGNGQTGIPGCGPSNNTPPKCQCFLRGTRLLTPDGEIAIEDLKIGDFVTTTDGEMRAIRWIGKRALARAEGWHEDVLPVRISKGALGSNTPHRDLYVTRAHLLYLNGVLIPASDLINGGTISAVTPDVDAIEYFHVELGSHEVVLAEGAPCESLQIVAGQIPAFDNRAEYEALYGHLASVDMAPYAPIASFNGGRGELKSRLRSALAPVIDFRRPLDVVRDNVEARALLSKAA